MVPGRGNICIITSSATDKEQGGAGCTENAAAIAGKLWLHGSTRSAPGVELVAGLVPDDVHNVTLHLTNGETQAIPVHENMYLIEVHGSVASVATKASGSSHGA